MHTSALSAGARAPMQDFMRCIMGHDFLTRLLVHNVKNRVQDFADPITSTLILMTTTPMQMMFCETGMLLFRTTMLPVMPFDKMTPEERACMRAILAEAPEDAVTETYSGGGKYTVHVKVGHLPLLHKRDVLLVLVAAMTRGGMTAAAGSQQAHQTLTDPLVMRRLCDIVIQRFISSISMDEDDIRACTAALWGEQRPSPPALPAPDMPAPPSGPT